MFAVFGVLLIAAGVAFFHWIVPVISRFGLFPNSVGGTIGCGLAAVTATLVLGGLILLLSESLS